MKKILSVILALALAVSLLAGTGITAFADGEEILYEAYVAGELPEISAGDEAVDVQLFDINETFTAETEWLDDEGEAFSGIFDEGNIYWLTVTLTANDGYLFGDGESVSVFVNYMWTDWAETSTDGTKTVFEIRFSLLPTISVVEIEGVTEPVLGEAPILDGITVSEDAHYYIDADSAYWYDEKTGEIEEDEFEMSVYSLCFDVYTDGSFDFSDNVEVYINGEQTMISETMRNTCGYIPHILFVRK